MELLFGIDASPATADLDETFARARLADQSGIDLLTMQDHPYNRRFLDTWTLLTTIAARTERIHVGTNVASLPLRPPAMLAKAAATLDVISGGRVELGIGAGAFWQGIAAYGGDSRTPGEAYAAFDDALHILRGMWSGGSFSYAGKVYSVKGAQPGPAPAHPIRIWAGANGPRMMNLTGRMADGVLVSTSYVPVSRWAEINRQIDDGAAETGRSPDDIRRGYNLMGTILPDGSIAPADQQGVTGTARDWVDFMTRLHAEQRVDTFVFWPGGDRRLDQIERYAKEVVPAVREAVEVERTR